MEEKNIANKLDAFSETLNVEKNDHKAKLEIWNGLTDEWTERQTDLLRELSSNTDSLISEKIMRDKCTGN